MHRRFVLALTLSILAGSRLAAHDFWLAASPWTPGGSLTITGNVGHFPESTEYPDPAMVRQWRVVGVSGDLDVQPSFRRDGHTLAADVALPSPGVYLATMAVLPRTIQMKGPAFTSYLYEEGLDWVVTAREKSGLSEQPATERYARYAKVAVRNGAGSGSHLLRPVGFPVEFVPMTDPTLLRAGQLLTLQLLAHDRPVAGAAVTARAGGGGHPVMGRTNAMGQVTLPIDRDGAWLVRTVHMVSGTAAGVPDVEWDSYWASFAFHTAVR